MLAGSCAHHPERAAIGVCVLCRKPICIECSTPMAGIHRCAACLESLKTDVSASQTVSRAHPLLWSMILFGLILSTFGWAALAKILE